jgi:hypothetical protein
MKPKAITEANVRLERARGAVTLLESKGFNFTELESAWWAFLLAAAGFTPNLSRDRRGIRHARDGWPR